MRKLRRKVARKRMTNAGYNQVCKRKYGESYFSKHWREFV